MSDPNEFERSVNPPEEPSPAPEEAAPAWPGRVEPAAAADPGADPAAPVGDEAPAEAAAAAPEEVLPPEGPDISEDFNLSREIPPIRDTPPSPPVGYPGSGAVPPGPAGYYYPPQAAQQPPVWPGQTAGYPNRPGPGTAQPGNPSQPVSGTERQWGGPSQPGYGQPGQNWNQPAPPQQSQWTFHDYGPVGGAGKPPKPPKPPKEKKSKEPRENGEPVPRVKKEKKPGAPGNGYKALAILMCVLFVLSVGGFGAYVWYDLSRGPIAAPTPNASEPAAGSRPDGGASKPSLNIHDTPDEDSLPLGEEDPDATGKLTGNQIHQAVEPAVVGVVGYVKSSVGTTMASQGSGVIMTEDGYIVTNNHVITNERTNTEYDRVEVIVSNGDRYEAAVKGRDKDSDLAVLKIDASGLKTAVFGDSDKVKVGDRAYVIGNPSGLEFAGSFTGGYISAVNRFVEVENIGSKVEFIQTDAAINPGNSGGALVNEYGQVIGITSAKLIEEAYEGMGFAIPINNAKPIIDSLIENGWVRGRVQIGITYLEMREIDSQLNGIPRGLRVATINEGSDAKEKGVLPGDIIYQMDGKEVYNSDTIAEVLADKAPGDTVKLSIFRVDENDKSQRFEVDVILQEKVPEDVTPSR